jgi:hypothetical protein
MNIQSQSIPFMVSSHHAPIWGVLPLGTASIRTKFFLKGFSTPDLPKLFTRMAGIKQEALLLTLKDELNYDT